MLLAIMGHVTLFHANNILYNFIHYNSLYIKIMDNLIKPGEIGLGPISL